MAELRVKMRADADIFGKPKVFFAVHPREFNKYFKDTTELLFKYSDCAVFYKDPELDYTDGEYRRDIAEMQLVVAPVTTRLLTDGADALADVRLAIEKRIPVLPIVEEVGLVELFNKALPSLQYLDKTSKDSTEICFDAKVEKFLSAVLIGDELSEKIRAAFDAYVFLSYRKKDREHAQRLMRLVHQNPACRDIAIWYDEFLVPGEDFNHSIRRALMRSDLFLIAVTPNLVNEHNYVEEVEYPMAIEEGKPVLPVEMVPTDSVTLGDRFKDIPSATPAEAQLISDNLILAIERIALRKNDTPEHTYFIGLAYLSGIDVEVDFDRARELITEAAEASLPEAVDRLITMYRSGIGVPRSYQNAIEWEERRNAILESKYSESGSYDDFLSLFSAYVENADHERDRYHYDDAKTKYRSAIELAERSGYQPRVAHTLAEIHIRIGDVHREEMKHRDAERSYLSARRICESATDDTISADDRAKLLAACLDRLGDVMLAVGRSRDAIATYESALGIAESLLRSGSTDDRRRLADLYYSIGRAYYEEGRYEQAIGSVDRASMDIYSLLIETRDFELMRDYFRYDMLLYEMYMAEENYISASNKIFSARLSAEKLVEVYDDIDSHRMLITMQNAMCTLDREEKYKWHAKIEVILESHEQIFAELDKYFENVATPGVMQDVIECTVNRALTCKLAKLKDDAIKWADNGLEIAIYTARENPSVKTKLDLANTYAACGDIAYTYGDARQKYERAVELYRELLSETDLSGIKLSLVKTLNQLAIVLYKTERKEEAKEIFLTAYSTLTELLEYTLSPAVVDEHVKVLSNLRIFSFNERDFELALRYADESIKYINDMLSKINTASKRRTLAKAYDGRALALKWLKQDDLMRESQRLAKYNAALADKIDSNEELESASATFTVIDRIIRNGNYDSAEKNVREMVVMTMGIDREFLLYPSQLAMTLEKLACIKELKGDIAGKEKYLAEAALCRSGIEGETKVRKAWREPAANLYAEQINKMLCSPRENYDALKKLANKAIAIRESIAEDGADPDNKKALAELYTTYGHMLYNEVSDSISKGGEAPPVYRSWDYVLYDVPASRECLIHANRLLLELASERGEREDMIALATSYGTLESRVAREFEESEKYALMKFEILKELHSSSKDEEDVRGMAEAYGYLAAFYSGDKTARAVAAKYCEKSAELYGDLRSRYGNKKYGFKYENTYAIAEEHYTAVSDAEGKSRCRRKREEYFLSESDRLSAKTADAASVDEWSELVSAFFSLADESAGDLEAVLSYCSRALEVALQFERRLKVERASFEVAQCYMKLTDVYSDMHRLEDAIDCERLAVDKYDTLARTEPKKDYHLYKRTSLRRLADLCSSHGDTEHAAEYRTMAEAITDGN